MANKRFMTPSEASPIMIDPAGMLGGRDRCGTLSHGTVPTSVPWDGL
jgi:hypothetical protein